MVCTTNNADSQEAPIKSHFAFDTVGVTRGC